MDLLADAALKTTLVDIALWGIFFPALVTGLILLAVVLAHGERRSNEELRSRREA
jgi:hypothetical protein